jgi:hypothetical protein
MIPGNNRDYRYPIPAAVNVIFFHFGWTTLLPGKEAPGY